MCAALVGVLAFGAGATAVFATDNEAGTVALCAVGAAFSFIGILGRVPTRVSVGQTNVDFGAAFALQALLNEDSVEVRLAVARAIFEQTPRGRGEGAHPTPLSPLAESAARVLDEESLVRHIAAIAESCGFEVDLHVAYQREGQVARCDLTVSDYRHPGRVLVEVSSDPKIGVLQVERLLEAAGLRVGVAVSRAPSRPGRTKTNPLVFEVSWQGPSDDEAVASVLLAAVGAATS